MSRPCLYSLQDFTINGSLIATATSSVPGDRKSSKSLAIHPPQPYLDPNLSGVHDLKVDAIAFAKMPPLRVLKPYYAYFKGNFPFHSKSLTYLEWYGFPMKSIPAGLYMENLIALYMPHSSLEELWTGPKVCKCVFVCIVLLILFLFFDILNSYGY